MKKAMERQKRFYELYHKYQIDTMCLSYHERNHESYKEIVAMGRAIIPLLLSNLWNGWLPVMALADILGQCPFEVAEDDRGRYDFLNEKWYQWGREEGYI